MEQRDQRDQTNQLDQLKQFDQITCPYWLKRLPKWSHNADARQMQDVADDIERKTFAVSNVIKHHGPSHHNKLRTTKESTSKLRHLYSSLKHLPSDIELGTANVPPPVLDRYSSITCSRTAQSKAIKNLSPKLTSNTPLKEQYASILRASNVAAREHTAKLLGKPPPSTTKQIAPNKPKSPKKKKTSPRRRYQQNSPIPKKNESIREKLIHLKVANYRDNELKKNELYARVQKIEDHKHLANRIFSTTAAATPKKETTVPIATRLQQARDRFETHWTHVMKERVESRDKNSAAAWGARLKQRRDQRLLVAVALCSRASYWHATLKKEQLKRYKRQQRIKRTHDLSHMDQDLKKLRSLDPEEHASLVIQYWWKWNIKLYLKTKWLKKHGQQHIVALTQYRECGVVLGCFVCVACFCCVTLLCIIVVCHCCVCVGVAVSGVCHCCVPLLCATIVCHCCVPLLACH